MIPYGIYRFHLVCYHPLLLGDFNNLLSIFLFPCFSPKTSTSTHKEESLKHAHTHTHNYIVSLLIPSNDFPYHLDSRIRSLLWPQGSEWLYSPFLPPFSPLIIMLHHTSLSFLKCQLVPCPWTLLFLSLLTECWFPRVSHGWLLLVI